MAILEQLMAIIINLIFLTDNRSFGYHKSYILLPFQKTLQLKFLLMEQHTAELTTSGWFFLIFAWTVITGSTIACYYRIRKLK